MSKILVIARTGLSVPKESSKERIDSSKPVSVPNSRYYRRLIIDGSLDLVSAAPEVGNKTDEIAIEPKKAGKK